MPTTFLDMFGGQYLECNCKAKTVLHDLGGTHLQCINKNMVSLCFDAIIETYDQGGNHLLCKNNEIVRLKVY